jgi:hypothetical protein
VVGTVRADGSFRLNAATPQFSGTTMRCGLADGNGNYWAGGGATGVLYLGSNAPPANLWNSSNTRRLLFVNGSIYFCETGAGQDIYAFSGAPTSVATATLVLSPAGTGTGTASPQGFALNSALTIAYVADNRTAANGGGIQRFNWNGSSWVYAYTISYKVTSSTEVEDLAVDFTRPYPIIYATTGESTANSLVKVTDTGPYSAYTILASAPSGDVFRGVTFAPAAH